MPVIFETMIFGYADSELRQRYCTEADAVAGHARAVADLRDGRPPWFTTNDAL